MEEKKTAEIRQGLIKDFIYTINNIPDSFFAKLEGTALEGTRAEQIKVFSDKIKDISREDLMMMADNIEERDRVYEERTGLKAPNRRNTKL